MKKLISLLFFVTFNFFLFAESPLESFKKKYANSVQASKIESIGAVGELSLFIIVSEEDWWEQAVFFNSKTNVTKEIPEITEQAILSAKIVRTKKDSFFEIVGITHKGLGNIYLFDSSGKCFFSYDFVDSNLENEEYPDYAKVPCLRESVRNKMLGLSDDYFEGYSKVFENDTLNIDYSKYDAGILRIFGVCNYVGHNFEDDRSKVFGSEKVEREFSFSEGDWVLTRSKGRLGNVPHLETNKIYNLWDY